MYTSRRRRPPTQLPGDGYQNLGMSWGRRRPDERRHGGGGAVVAAGVAVRIAGTSVTPASQTIASGGRQLDDLDHEQRRRLLYAVGIRDAAAPDAASQARSPTRRR
jgi:hypothetical protein